MSFLALQVLGPLLDVGDLLTARCVDQHWKQTLTPFVKTCKVWSHAVSRFGGLADAHTQFTAVQLLGASFVWQSATHVDCFLWHLRYRFMFLCTRPGASNLVVTGSGLVPYSQSD